MTRKKNMIFKDFLGLILFFSNFSLGCPLPYLHVASHSIEPQPLRPGAPSSSIILRGEGEEIQVSVYGRSHGCGCQPMVIDGRGYDRAPGPMHTARPGSTLAPQYQLGTDIPRLLYEWSVAAESETRRLNHL